MITINCEIITHKIQLLCFLKDYLTAMTQEINLQKSWRTCIKIHKLGFEKYTDQNWNDYITPFNLVLINIYVF